MNNKEIREKYEEKTLVLGRIISKLGVTPNQITIISVIVAIIGTWNFYIGEFICGVSLFVIAVLLDVIDGAVARATKKITKFGKIFDPIIDRVVEFLLLLGLSLGRYVNPNIAFIAFFSMLMPSYVRTKAESEIKIKLGGKGVVERKEKLGIIFIAIILRIMNYDYMNHALLIVSLLSIISAIQRIKITWDYCK